MQVNNLPLPKLLLDLIKANKWELPEEQSAFKTVFKHTMDEKLIRGLLYSLKTMKSETAALFEDNPSFIEMFHGKKDENFNPGDIDPTKVVFIGDLGLGSDQPIALDYRLDESNPKVITLLWRSLPKGNRWITISENFEEFVEMIGLESC
jgi:hypothetical protein